MLALPRHELPGDKERMLRKAQSTEWLTIICLLMAIGLMYVTMGSSQAMKTAWVEDVLSLVGPAAFLVSTRVARRPPGGKYPYGYHRAVTIAFLCGSVALLAVGLVLVFDGAKTLVSREHPTIGAIDVMGYTVWQGWAMFAALVISAIPPVVLGRIKLKQAQALHDKTLFADAHMNQADWKTAVAAVLGVFGIGVGLWWADAAAACLIALDVTWDGFRNVGTAVADLMNRRPMAVDESRPETLPEALVGILEGFPYVSEADVRLREEGHVFMGEAFVVFRDDADLTARIEVLLEAAHAADWRVYGLTIMPVAKIEMPEDARG